MEVLEETFPRGASWEVSVIFSIDRHQDGLYAKIYANISLHLSTASLIPRDSIPLLCSGRHACSHLTYGDEIFLVMP
jgi:hypothetical protein